MNKSTDTIVVLSNIGILALIYRLFTKVDRMEIHSNQNFRELVISTKKLDYIIRAQYAILKNDKTIQSDIHISHKVLVENARKIYRLLSKDNKKNRKLIVASILYSKDAIAKAQRKAKGWWF